MRIFATCALKVSISTHLRNINKPFEQTHDVEWSINPDWFDPYQRFIKIPTWLGGISSKNRKYSMPRWLTVRPWGSSSSPAICFLRVNKKPWLSTWHAQKSGVSGLVPPCCQHFGLCEFDSSYYFPSGLTQCLWWISLWFDSWICQHHHTYFHRDWRNVYGNLDVTS